MGSFATVCFPIEVGLASQSTGSEFEEPRKHQRGNEAHGEEDDDRPAGGLLETEHRQQGFHQLHDEPRAGQVGGGNAKYVASLQLIEPSPHDCLPFCLRGATEFTTARHGVNPSVMFRTDAVSAGLL